MKIFPTALIPQMWATKCPSQISSDSILCPPKDMAVQHMGIMQHNRFSIAYTDSTPNSSAMCRRCLHHGPPNEGLCPSQLSHINTCHMYLWALCVSNITTISGQQITNIAWKGSHKCVSSLKWLFQDKPPEIAWTLWRSFLKYTLTLDAQSLFSPRGQWIPTPHYIIHEFQFVWHVLS